MKKIKLFSSIVIVCLIVSLTCFSAFAETYYITDGYKYMLDDDNNAYLAGVEDDRTELMIPAEIDRHPVTATTMLCCNGNTSLESVTFENAENMSIIGAYGFYNCSNLKSANLGSYVTELYRGVFRGCTSLESVELSDNLKEIPYESFYGCTSLGEITIGRNITLIQENAFIGCPNLVIRCYCDSYAYQFALDHSIPYILLDGALLGDANGDGYVNVNDVTVIQRHAAELELLEGINFHAADINGDGNVSVDDATELQRFLAEYVVDYPIGEVMTQ